ncbi:MAG: prenyltransferase/squalene oxidase repeat-containing protein, partial [Pirellulales bacterium]
MIVSLMAAPLVAAGDADTTKTATGVAAASSAVKLSRLAVTGPKPAPITPPEPAAIDAAIERGVKFLLADQRPDGSWGSPEKTKGLNIYAPPPGAHDAFRTAVTALAIMALIEAQPSRAADEQPTVAKAIDRGAAWLDERVGRLRRATPDALYNVWGHAYAIQALVKLHERAAGDSERQAKLKELAQGQAKMLERYSFVGGGWSYYDFVAGTQTPGDSAFSFCTATALIALKQAESIGVEFSERLTKKAIASILRQQKPDFSYAYGEYLRMMPMHLINRPGGSLGRSQACNLALRLHGDERISNEVLKTWLDRLFARNGWLSVGRKRPIPHESFFYV